MAKLVGQQAEQAVAKILAERGLKIIAKNVSFPFGELDLVADHQGTVVFIEVKYRKDSRFSMPYDAVTKAKQKKIILAAQAFLQKFKELPPCRFDVVSVQGDLQNPLVEHFEDAFMVEDY